MPLEVLTDAQSGWRSVIKRDLSTGPLRCHLLLAMLYVSREMMKNGSFVLGSSSRKNSQTQLKWRCQPWRAPDGSANQAKQRILCLRATCSCQCGIQNMFSIVNDLSVFNYEGNNFNFCNQFIKTLLFPVSWHGWKMATSPWKRAEGIGSRMEWWKEPGIPNSREMKYPIHGWRVRKKMDKILAF